MTGVDIAAKAIEAARKVVQERGVSAKLHVADATRWKPIRIYDLIVSSFALPESKAGRALVYRTIRGAIAAVFGGASWQRCRTHFMANLLTRVPRRAQPWVATMVRTIYQQPSPDEVHAQLDRVTDQLKNRFPQVASLLDEAGPDVLAFSNFPLAHWKKIWSNNPQERLNKEIRRRTDVVGIFPNRPAVRRLLAPSWLSSTTNRPLAVDTSHLSC